MHLVDLVVALVVIQRLIELGISARNTRKLRAMGGIESGRGHYPLFILLHGGWLAAIWFTADRPNPANLSLLALFLMLQGMRIWIISSLGYRWTTRVIAVPGLPLVQSGPYRWLKHPNYIVVAIEIAVLPLAFGAYMVALVATALNAALIAHRIRVENQALRKAARMPPIDKGALACSDRFISPTNG